MKKEIVLALGGGGVKGVAHLGVIKCLQDHDYIIKGIAGTSAGGMCGAVMAAGYSPDEIGAVISEFLKSPDFSRNRHDNPSIMGTQGVEKVLQPYLVGRSIESLPIPFVATSVSLKTGKEVVISTGDVLEAVLSTIAIPGIFPYRGGEDLFLVDGGVLDPVPVKMARQLNKRLPIVAVALNRKPSDFSPADTPLPIQDEFPKPIFYGLSKLRITESLRIMYASYEMLCDRLTELHINQDNPDVLVTPLVGHFSSLQKIDGKAFFDEGYRAMQEELPSLEEACGLVKSVQRFARYGSKK